MPVASRGAAVATAATWCGLTIAISCSSGSPALEGSEATDAAADRAVAKAEGGLDGSSALVEATFPEVSLPEGACGEGAPCAAAVPLVLVSHQPTPAGI